MKQFVTENKTGSQTKKYTKSLDEFETHYASIDQDLSHNFGPRLTMGVYPDKSMRVAIFESNYTIKDIAMSHVFNIDKFVYNLDRPQDVDNGSFKCVMFDSLEECIAVTKGE